MCLSLYALITRDKFCLLSSVNVRFIVNAVYIVCFDYMYIQEVEADKQKAVSSKTAASKDPGPRNVSVMRSPFFLSVLWSCL